MQIVVHWQAVVLATAAAWVLFVLWFSPFIFGGMWQRLEQLSDEGVHASLLPRLGLALLAAAAQAYCLAGFFNFTASTGFVMGALAGLQLCLGLALPALVLVLVMGRRSPALIAVYGGWLLLAQVVSGGILAAWH